MAIVDLIIVGALAWFLVALLRANGVLSRNPHQQVKAQEELAGPFPESVSLHERLRLVGWRGISSNTPNRIWVILLAVVGLIVFRLWPSAVFERDLELTFADNAIVPAFARTPDGTPFTGTAYGTFFRDRFSCVEWSGPFESGVPHGVFAVFENCRMGERQFIYQHGTLQNTAKPALRP